MKPQPFFDMLTNITVKAKGLKSALDKTTGNNCDAFGSR